MVRRQKLQTQRFGPKGRSPGHPNFQRLVEAGFEDRVMFGTDQLVWPKLMELSIEVIDRASYLTPQQKRDILYNNAARFLRLDSAATKASARP